MATVSPLYGSSNQPITITLNSLASGAQRQSTAISNTSNLYLDAFVQFSILPAASGVAATGAVKCYLYATANSGSTYGDTVAGTDGAVTLSSPPNLRLLTVLNANVSGTTAYNSDPVSVAAAYGGVMPDHWGIVIENDTGQSFASTATANLAWYQGVNQTVI